MEIYFEATFEKDLKKIKDKKALHPIRDIIEKVKKAAKPNDIPGLKKMKGYETFYRIRWGDYRLGFELDEKKVIFVRCLQRKDIYKYFPA